MNMILFMGINSIRMQSEGFNVFQFPLFSLVLLILEINIKCWLKYISVFNGILAFINKLNWHTMREKCPYSQLFWSAFSGIWTEYGEIL